MAVYPVIQQPAPWNDLRELGIEITVAGETVAAVVSVDPVVGNISVGDMEFEATAPYVLVESSDIAALGDLHGAAVVIGTDNYIVRNVHPKLNINMTRLVLDAR